MKSMWIALSLSLPFSPFAYGEGEENKISFDFSKMTISTFGVFNTNQEEQNSSLKAEVNARKNAIQNIGNYFKTTCQKIEKGQLGTKPEWENFFHSQGSEIFSNGVVKVSLAAPFRDVLKTPNNSKKKPVLTDDGKKIAFSMLFTLPGNSVQCGAIILDVGSNKKVLISPSKVVSSSIGLTVVKLVYDGKSELKPATPEDATIIQNSTLAKDPYVPASVIPIVVVVPEP
ncbi:hypothetical protein GCL60_14435 [Silvanigrella paludirubra]|uniref:Uncharacterized protein n=1 Tax=Silvanigrella paludirubra TaxID=2499159 RepID=A0A6N6VQR7_9BACT|nr:hypothetical protein [Silvanigrella paludirubra]KAB8037027.1 hypothetical protein GCL60_14435 [Silvanigrella paludirubra]